MERIIKKKCSRCKRNKELKDFYSSRREKSGVEYKCKRCASARQKDIRAANWRKILDHYGKECFCCGEKIVEFLTIDHINKNGAEDRRKYNRGRLYAYIVREDYPATFRIACMNCNFSLGLRHYCPHQVRH